MKPNTEFDQTNINYPNFLFFMVDNLDKWRRAGQIAAQAREYGRSLIKPGASLLEVSDKIEAKIKQLGAGMAFPAQISCDSIAAHYCAHPRDDIVFDKQVVCLDVGVEVDGCIGDTACTVDLSGGNEDLVQASKDALAAAIEAVKKGASMGQIGAEIQKAISAKGFAPVRNLSGHGISEYEIHTKPSVPNFDSGETNKPQKGSIIAIEPFATNGKGLIQEAGASTIYSLIKSKPVRDPFARKLLKHLEQLKGLPFTTRWLYRDFSPVKVAFALRELTRIKALHSYPPLVEVGHGLVSQAEHTLYIGDEIEVLTEI